MNPWEASRLAVLLHQERIAHTRRRPAEWPDPTSIPAPSRRWDWVRTWLRKPRTWP
ncbi:MAG: hypothetical protein JO023_18975, partial [Chloroflexi bacterium]|nr:hypothetical protein [Chloroflexota bacterium]